jgi:hypothetical protein
VAEWSDSPDTARFFSVAEPVQTASEGGHKVKFRQMVCHEKGRYFCTCGGSPSGHAHCLHVCAATAVIQATRTASAASDTTVLQEKMAMAQSLYWLDHKMFKTWLSEDCVAKALESEGFVLEPSETECIQPGCTGSLDEVVDYKVLLLRSCGPIRVKARGRKCSTCRWLHTYKEHEHGNVSWS